MFKRFFPSSQAGDANRRRRKRWLVWAGRLSLLGVFLLIVGGVALYVYLKPYYEKAEQVDLSVIAQLEAASILYDRNGKELASIFVQNRRPVALEEIPDHVIKALIAVEDSRFWEHDGVDYWGIARAALVLAKKRKVTQGASTITQQLGRDAFLTTEREMSRKLTEAFLARRIEKAFSKEEILEHYLNRIFFGHSFYGINAASYGYFGKHVSELTVEEGATICGLIKSPNRYSPLVDREASLLWRNHVLDRMEIEGYIRPEDCAMLKKRPLVTNTLTSISRSSYVHDYIRQRVAERVGRDRAAVGGFRILTTVDMHLQMQAERSLLEQLNMVENGENFPHPTLSDYVGERKKAVANQQIPPAPNYLQGALMAVDNEDGGIVALVGGRNYAHSQYNRATQAARPPGSAIKPLVYAAAFENGTFPGTILQDKVMDNRFVGVGGMGGLLGEWAVETGGQQYLGDITARQALVMSKNAATARLGTQAGLATDKLQPFREFAELAGIESGMSEYASSFLGSSPLTLGELVKAYTIFPNLGARPQDLYIIREIQTGEGVPIYSSTAVEAPLLEVTDEFAAYQTHSCLQEVLVKGTARQSFDYGLQKFPSVAGKTGTAYDFTDVWFVGYTDRITCGVWSGFDLPRSIYPGAFSNKIVLPAWVSFMNATARSFPPGLIEAPTNGKYVEICTVSGQVATDACYERLPSSTVTSPRFERSAVIELVRPDVHLSGACQLHSPDSELDMLRKETEDLVLPSNYTGEGPPPVFVRAPTIVGFDPYNALQPVIALNATSTDGEGTGEEGDAMAVTKASVVPEKPVMNPAARVTIEFPVPIELDD